MATQCASCGGITEGVTSACHYCGAPLASASQPSPPRKAPPRKPPPTVVNVHVTNHVSASASAAASATATSGPRRARPADSGALMTCGIVSLLGGVVCVAMCCGAGGTAVNSTATQQATQAVAIADEPELPKLPRVLPQAEGLPSLEKHEIPTLPITGEDLRITGSIYGREFTSTKGTKVRAELVEFRFQGSRVILKTEDGREVDVSMNDLSKDDQQWVREEIKRRKSR